jgi:hypothetical protein
MARGRMSDNNRNQICDIDDGDIELYAMNRLSDVPVREHIDSCASCLARVAEDRYYITALKTVLRDMKARKPAAFSGGDAQSTSAANG